MRGILWGLMGLLFTAKVLAAEAAYVENRAVSSKYATQAAAVDEKFIYAVASKEIAKINRGDGVEVAVSKGEASHLNSAVLMDGGIYCAHSNFPAKPERGDIRVLDRETMVLSIFHEFTDPPGSLTWALKKGGDWWCHFARYGADNGKSILVRYSAEWKEQARWTYPADLVADWGKMSLSGAVWKGDDLLATGHDKRVVYRLKIPAEGKVIVWEGTRASPFPGQGIALDPVTGGLVGIDRKRRAVVFAEAGKR